MYLLVLGNIDVCDVTTSVGSMIKFIYIHIYIYVYKHYYPSGRDCIPKISGTGLSKYACNDKNIFSDI
jgi:hypothetical protein